MARDWRFYLTRALAFMVDVMTGWLIVTLVFLLFT